MFICFRDWANLFVFWQKNVRVSKKQTTITEKKLEERYCRKIVFYINFGLRAEKVEQLEKKFSQDCQNYIQSVQRNKFRTFLSNEKTLIKFLGRWAKLLGFWCEFFVKISQNCSLRVQRNVLMFFFGEKSICLIVFGLLAKKNRLLAKNIWHLAMLLKVHFTCPQQNFEKKWQK